MKTATATTNVEVNVYCPHCNTIQDIFFTHPDQVREEFNYHGEMRSDDCEIEVECDTCKEDFLITMIEF